MVTGIKYTAVLLDTYYLILDTVFMNIVLMAGGGGTRLWPLSRNHKPKQFLDLGSGKTLLEHTYDRARTVADAPDIFVATTVQYHREVERILREVPAQNIFDEPTRRDTGPALAAAAVALKRRGKEREPATFMWSDHVFTAEDQFLQDLQKIPQLIAQHPEAVIILGHRPNFPETGLGYIEVGQHVSSFDDVFHVISFKEKPDQATAQRYLEAGNFFWNMGYVGLTPGYLLQELAVQAPELSAGIAAFAAKLAEKDLIGAAQVYSTLPKISIDYALLEKTPRVIAVTGDYGWSDVGNWGAVQEIFGTKGDHMPYGHHIHFDAQDNYVYNATNKVVSLLGVRDSIVVVTDDAVLVTNKQSSHKVKDVVAKLEEAGKAEYL